MDLFAVPSTFFILFLIFVMPSHSENTRRIAKNTLMLYVRMLFGMLVSLYTSRVVLQALGVEDYGIYNVVGGLVGMFSIISGSLSASVSRFLTFELGRGGGERLDRIFSTAVWIFIFIAFVVFVLTETAGLWFLNTHMAIPHDRILAANWVFHLSVSGFMLALFSIPYNASIVAHERMSAFAYIGILEVLLRLAVVLFIAYVPVAADHLVVFGFLQLAVYILLQAIYWLYCHRHFPECRIRWCFDRRYWREMSTFAGWNFIGASSAILRDAGGNVVLNMFCGPMLNAARGISQQVNNAVTGFSNNFLTAANPQITKSYAADDRDYMLSLIFRVARFSFYLLLALSLPIMFNTEFILAAWLKTVPGHTSDFVRLVLVYSILESISSPLVTVMLATGRIRNYQLVVGGLQMMNLPLTYVSLRMGAVPESILVIAIVLSVCCLVARLVMLRGMVGLPVRRFVRQVIGNVTAVTVLAMILPLLFGYCVPLAGWTGFILSSVICLLSASTVIYFVGCSNGERCFIRSKLVAVANKTLRRCSGGRFSR